MTDETHPLAVGPDVKAVHDYLVQMDEEFRAAGITHFTAREVCLMRKVEVTAYAIPPKHLWPRMVKTLHHIAEPLRMAYGGPLHVRSGFRPRDYNVAVGGAPNSRHIYFEAVDLTADNVDKLRNIASDLWV